MIKTVLVEILISLSKKEQKQFEQYVYSPFFNKNEKVRQLCSHLLTFAPVFEHDKLEKAYIYGLLFGDGTYQELRLNNVISDLLQLLYGYLSYQQQQSERQQQLSLFAALLERNLERPIPRLMRRIERLNQKKTPRSVDYYRASIDLFSHLSHHALNQNQHGKDENLQHISNALDVYYWTHKLHNACEMLNRTRVIDVSYRSVHLDYFLDYYQQNQLLFEAYPVLQTYYQAYQFLKNSTEEAYITFRDLLQQHQSLFPQSELRTLYTYLRNFCVRQVNYGNISYYKESLQIYKNLIDNNLLLTNGYLSQWSFINAVTSGIRVKAYEWTEQFIQDFQLHLKESERKNTVDYQLAALYFAKAEYEKTLDFLQQVEFTDILYQVSAKLILMKVYYELEETEAFYPLVNATNNLLYRTRKLSGYHRKSYSNFIKLTKKLHDLKISRKRNVSEKLSRLEASLKTMSPLANKGWLLEKYEVLLSVQ